MQASKYTESNAFRSRADSKPRSRRRTAAKRSRIKPVAASKRKKPSPRREFVQILDAPTGQVVKKPAGKTIKALAREADQKNRRVQVKFEAPDEWSPAKSAKPAPEWAHGDHRDPDKRLSWKDSPQAARWRNLKSTLKAKESEIVKLRGTVASLRSQLTSQRQEIRWHENALAARQPLPCNLQLFAANEESLERILTQLIMVSPPAPESFLWCTRAGDRVEVGKMATDHIKNTIKLLEEASPHSQQSPDYWFEVARRVWRSKWVQVFNDELVKRRAARPARPARVSKRKAK